MDFRKANAPTTGVERSPELPTTTDWVSPAVQAATSAVFRTWLLGGMVVALVAAVLPSMRPAGNPTKFVLHEPGDAPRPIVRRDTNRVAPVPVVVSPELEPGGREPEMARLEAQLRAAGATSLLLERIGDPVVSYRFSCGVPVAPGAVYSRPFEARDRTAVAAMRSVLASIQGWRLAAREPPPSGRVTNLR